MPKMYQSSLTLDEKFRLAQDHIDNLRKHHDGEMYGCPNCYYRNGYKCSTRALIQVWDYITQEMDLA